MDSIIINITRLAIPILLALTLHEYAHGWVANRLGDPTARLMGRLTFNPIRHLDPIGTLVFFVTGMFGWAKPVPVNALQLRDPRRDMAWVALAGPLTNLFLAALSVVCLKLLYGVYTPSMKPLIEPLAMMAEASIYINVALAVFNILPIPPLDGSRVMSGLLPYRQAVLYEQIEPYGFIILVLLLWSGVVGAFLGPVVYFIVSILKGGLF